MEKNTPIVQQQVPDKSQTGRLELRIKAAELRKPVMLKHWAPSAT